MENGIEALEQHLLYHKALAESPEEVTRINGYLNALRNETGGTRLNNDVEEAIRRMFAMVIDNGMDPWAIDLENFVTMYAESVSERPIDMVVAGKFMSMAWRVLSMQTAQSRDRFDPPIVYEEDTGDFETEDEDFNFIPIHDVSMTKSFTRQETRKVTVLELLDAFDEAVHEEEIRKAREETSKKLRDARKSDNKNFDNKAHEEDDETVVRRVYRTIHSRYSTGPLTMSGFYNGSLKDDISFFVSVLHLVRYGLVEVEQESLPSGTITIRVVDPSITEVPQISEA